MEFIRTTLAEVVALSVPMPMHASLNGYEGCVWTSVEMRCFKDCEGAHESFFFFLSWPTRTRHTWNVCNIWMSESMSTHCGMPVATILWTINELILFPQFNIFSTSIYIGYYCFLCNAKSCILRGKHWCLASFYWFAHDICFLRLSLFCTVKIRGWIPYLYSGSKSILVRMWIVYPLRNRILCANLCNGEWIDHRVY